MRTTQGNTLLSLQNVQAYLTENAATLGDGIPAQTRALLDDAIIELTGHAMVQNGHTRAEKSALARQRTKRQVLIRDHMARIAKIATLELANTPELVSLTLPKGQPTAERLAALADGMAQAAEPYAQVFTSAGCKPEFIQELRTAAEELLRARQDRAQSTGKVRTATSGLQTKLARGRKVVHVIDVFMKTALANDPDRLAGWKLVKRVPQPRNGSATGSSAGTGGAATPVPTLAPAPAPALVAAAA